VRRRRNLKGKKFDAGKQQAPSSSSNSDHRMVHRRAKEIARVAEDYALKDVDIVPA
jgi:hypothetical protein